MQKFNPTRQRLGPAAKLAAGVLAALVAIFHLSAGAQPSFAVQIHKGDLIVVDYHHLANDAVVLDIDPLTGAQTVISSGQNLTEPTDVCFDASGNILVADYGYNLNDNGRIVRIDPATGQQTVLSIGGILAHPTSVAVDSLGRIVVAQEGVNQAVGAVLRIDPVTGAQTQITSGQHVNVPTGLALDSNGDYIISNFQNSSSIVKVDAATGAQSLVSSGGYFSFGPEGICLDTLDNQSAWVTEFGGNELIKVDLASGAQTLVSAGGLIRLPDGVTQNSLGLIYMTDHNSSFFGDGRILTIDPLTGAQLVLSSGGNLISPSGIIVAVPEPGSLTLLAIAGGILLASRRFPRRT